MTTDIGFEQQKRQDTKYRPVDERIKDYSELEIPLSEEILIQQSARCIDCGIPFCHGTGCPLKNIIPEINEYLHKKQWKKACEILHTTNNFPEITGRVCPAPCEAACTLSINDEAVLIKHIEYQIAERGFKEDWIKPIPAQNKTRKRVMIIGSGPAGLAAAQQLVRAGHEVIVMEKKDSIGGLLRYGIPNFKLDKSILMRRIRQLQDEGVQFTTGIHVGKDISIRYLRRIYDAVCIAIGAETPRDLPVPGRQFENVVFATDYLEQQNRICAGENINTEEVITAKNKIVVILGGGDTGSDCVGTARRQGAKEIYQFELLPTPPESGGVNLSWPTWPNVLRTSSSHLEGCTRRWGINTKGFSGLDTRVNKLSCVEVKWSNGPHGPIMQEIPGSEFSMKVDIVLLALGFLHVSHDSIVKQFDLYLDARGNVKVDNRWMTSQEGIFAAGDAVTGSSLVARAINSGRIVAEQIDYYLRNK